MLVIGAVVGAVDATRADLSAANDYSIASFAGNLIGLQTVVVEPFGGNYALWSLANETWYYIQFPLLLLMFMGRNRIVQLAAATALVLSAAVLPFPIVLYFLLWLLGAVFSRLRIDCGNAWRAALVATALGVAVWFRLFGTVDDLKPGSFGQHLAYSLALLTLLASLHAPVSLRSWPMRALARTAHVLSECSFTLYVMHIPLIVLLRHVGLQDFGRTRLSPFVPGDYAIYAGMLVAIALLSYVSYLLFESRTFRIRSALKAAIQQDARGGATATAASK
jgi:peptidoglycan/LPS O-acetylase OafA/YrhL